MNNWTDIALFSAVAEAGSLSAAARQLGTSQPTLSRRLAALEEMLGVTLLDRSTHGLTLTPAGEEALDHARRMQEEAHAIQRLAEGQTRKLEGVVTISATEGLGTDWLPWVLRGFHEKYPGIILHLQVDNHSVDLVQREADIALRLVTPMQPSLIARKLASIRFGLFASPDYLGRYGVPQSIADLKQHRMIGGHGPLQVMGSVLEEELQGQLGDMRIVLSSNSPNAIKTAIKAGFGIGVLSLRMGLTRPQKYVRVLPNQITAERPLWLVTHEDVRRSARIRAVTDYLADQIKAFIPHFAGEEDAMTVVEQTRTAAL